MLDEMWAGMEEKKGCGCGGCKRAGPSAAEPSAAAAAAAAVGGKVVGDGQLLQEGDGGVLQKDGRGRVRMVMGKWERVVGHGPFMWRFTSADAEPGTVRVVWIAQSCVDQIPEVFGRLLGAGGVVPEEAGDEKEEEEGEVNEEDYNGDVDSED